MIHYGDITKINGADVPVVDVIVGGSPCQDLSVAGKRAGLDGERSGLFMEQLRIIKEMREKDARDGRAAHDVRPRYMVWENVPGAFSSNRGEDFRIVLEETAKIADKDAHVPRPDKWRNAGCIMGDGWSIAWRVLDAQFWGVPQRRRRIALVADFGGHSAPEILFVRKSVSGHSEPSESQRKETTRNASASVGADDRAFGFPLGFRPENVRCYEETGTTLCNGTRPGFTNGVIQQVVYENHSQDSRYKELGDVSETVSAKYGTGGNNQRLVVACGFDQSARQLDGVISLDRAAFNQGKNAQFDIGIDQQGIAQSLVARGPSAVCYNIRSYDSNAWKSNNPHSGVYETDKSKTLDAVGGLNPACNQGGTAVVERIPPVRYIVRRLTPMECERLQGYPSELKLDVSKMTKDEYIAYNIIEGNIIVDAEAGKVYRTRGPGGIKLEKPQEMKGSDSNGYLVVKISNGTTKMTCRIHRIIWISQYGIIPDGYCVDHINCNKKDNRISNLQLITPQENSTKAAQDGLYSTGEDNGATKISPDLWDEIAYLHHCEGKTLRQLAEIYGISKSRIHQIVKEVGWTDIGEYTDTNGKNRKCSDAARYKALGNSIALPPWKWVMKRISACYERDATLASLFDGIGGFPYIWEHINGKGSCLWASEIEEFCIAVTKQRIN